ncbi:uncharacterized protein A1O9_05303 [Exophiala aquamarina CBS 119918]|uniref:Uncharacterized protein n=1 Tax=Exophiala aquamarina CBS 119918 TaxID=1182545 RepID=A0A072PC09_9EURO|nr:uncharacterized protein A1O9_05303 [Exophiala aquamarina CBS 119918]KEF57386.1 hypothetical protein A1O9_05303 [Exophiala aquamarina CBS 119918]
MAGGVPQKTLGWLYDVLKREYHDPNRTYSDLAHVLSRYPGFGPRTDVYSALMRWKEDMTYMLN